MFKNHRIIGIKLILGIVPSSGWVSITIGVVGYGGAKWHLSGIVLNFLYYTVLVSICIKPSQALPDGRLMIKMVTSDI